MNIKTEGEKELYQSVRNKIKNDMKDVVTNLIHRTRDHLERDTVDADFIVNEVSKIVSSSEAYKTFKRSLVTGIVDVKHPGLDDKRNDWEGCLTSSFASLNSSLPSSSQCSYVILGTKDLQIATKLLQSPSLQDKFQSLNILRQTSSLEQFLNPQVWPSLLPALKEALFHPAVTVGEFCLDIFVNMMVCSSPFVVKEGYSGLLEFLSSYKVKDVEPYKSCSSNKIFLQALCITNKFQQCISQHWLRYPQNIMEDIVKNTLKHFSLSFDKSSKPDFTSIWTIMTIIDTDNIWLKNWLHERLSRKFVINAIQEHHEIIERVLQTINEFANETVTDAHGYKTCSFFMYEVSCSVCFLSRLLQYSEGRKLICIVHPSKTTVIGDVWNDIVKCILILCHNNCKLYNPNIDFALQAIYCLWERMFCMWNVEERVKILKPLLLPLECLKMDNIDRYMSVVNEVTKLLSALSEDDSARVDLCSLKLDGKFRDVIDWLTNGSGSEKFAGLHSLCNEILINIVKTCRNMLSTPHGILCGKDTVVTLVLIQSFQTCWSRSDCETPTLNQSVATKSETLKTSFLHEEISKAISILLSSPLGTSLLYEANYLLESIDYLIESYSGVCENYSTELNCNCYNRCFMWFSLYSSNTEAVQKNKLLQVFPNKIWQNFSFHIDNEDQHLKYTSFINKLKSLVFLYPSTAALYNEILCEVDTTDANKTWKSVCLLLLDGIFLVTDDLNYIGSSLLCSLVCNVKTLLFLEQKLQIRAFVLNLLNSNVINGVIVIDESSLLWNHILVRSYIIGGPKERRLPPKYIGDISENYTWPFASLESINDTYWQLEAKSQPDEQSLLPSFIPVVGHSQINLYEEMISYLKNNGQMKWQHLNVMLEKATEMIANDNFGLNFSCTTVQNLSDSENIGIDLAVQYGINLGIFSHSDNKTRELECTLQACRVSLDGITYKDEFDIFVASIFLLLKGDQHKTCMLIERYIHSQSCLYNWILPLQGSLRCHKLQHCHAILSQYFEVILKDSLPKVFSAFQICGLSPSAVLWQWTSQCYWNYLDWNEICHWMLLTVISGSGSILYFAIAVMKHLEQDILINAQSLTLLDYLKETPILEFQTCDHINFILKLSEKFHNQIENSIQECIEG